MPPGPVTPGHARILRDLAEAGRVPALGVPLPAGARSNTGSAVLPAGSRLLLFTDGLVERRDEPIDNGLARLAADAADLASERLDAWCEDVVAAQLDGREVEDDVAVLAVEFLGVSAAGAGAAASPKVEV